MIRKLNTAKNKKKRSRTQIFREPNQNTLKKQSETCLHTPPTNSGRDTSENCTTSGQAGGEDKSGYEAKDTVQSSRQMYLVDESGCLGQMWSVAIINLNNVYLLYTLCTILNIVSLHYLLFV